MRLMFEIPNDEFKVTVFNWNEKFLIEFEAGPFKQTYKIPVEKVKGEEHLRKIVDQLFLKQSSKIFDQMFSHFKATLDRNS